MTVSPTENYEDAADLLVLVNAIDEVVGYKDKSSCHDSDGLLHRAFSVFLFDTQGRLLLQRRSAKKRLWGGYWSNSCCSHPRPHESIAAASARRVREELGLSTSTDFLYKFEYRAQFFDLGAEHELCHVVAGLMPRHPVSLPDEVSAWRLVEPELLDRELEEQPAIFTPWLLLEWPKIRGQHWDQVTRLIASA